MKRLLSALLAVALILTAVPLTIAFADGVEETFVIADGVTYKVKPGDV